MTTLHAKKNAARSNFVGSVQEALDIIREEGRKAGEIKTKGVVTQGVALMNVAQSLYSKDDKVMGHNQNNARLAYVEGYNAGCLDPADYLSTNTKDTDFQVQASKVGVWIRAGYVFEDVSKVEPFIALLQQAIVEKPMPKGAYISMAERMLTALRAVEKDPTLTSANLDTLKKLVAPDTKKIKERLAKKAEAKKERDERKAAAKAATKADVKAEVTPQSKEEPSTDHDILLQSAKRFHDMLSHFEKAYPSLKARLAKIGVELAELAEAVEKEETARATRAKDTVEAVKEEARKADAPKPKARRTRGK